MPVWIRAVGVERFVELFTQELAAATQSADFETFAQRQGLTPQAAAAARAALRFEPDGPLSSARMHYGGEPRFVRIERLSGPQVRLAVAELLEPLSGLKGPVVGRVLETVAAAQELVEFELKQSDAKGMGWPLAFQTAMWLAAHSQGLVEADGEWWDPSAYAVLLPKQVL